MDKMLNECLKLHLSALDMQNHGVFFEPIRRLREKFAAVVRTFSRFEKSFL